MHGEREVGEGEWLPFTGMEALTRKVPIEKAVLSLVSQAEVSPRRLTSKGTHQGDRSSNT